MENYLHSSSQSSAMSGMAWRSHNITQSSWAEPLRCCSHVDFICKNMMVLYPPDASCVPLIFLSAIEMVLIFWCRMSSGLLHGDWQFCSQKPWPLKIWAQQFLWSFVGSNLSIWPLHKCQQPKLPCFQPHMQSSVVFRRIYMLQFTACLMVPPTV